MCISLVGSGEREAGRHFPWFERHSEYHFCTFARAAGEPVEPVTLEIGCIQRHGHAVSSCVSKAGAAILQRHQDDTTYHLSEREDFQRAQEVCV